METCALEDDEGADNALDALLQEQLDSVLKLQATCPKPQAEVDEDAPNSHRIGLPAWRQIAVNVVTHRDFESVIILLTVINCFALALYAPLEPPTSLPNVLMERTDEIVNICFTIEAILRMAAMGSVSKYFSSAWNAFDFVIVALGYLSYVNLGKQATGVRALRGFRALRPLRGMKFFRPLRIVVDCFLQALPLLASISGILVGCIFVSGLIGMQLFSEPYHRACVNDVTGEREAAGTDSMGQWGCGGARTCPDNYTCSFLPSDNVLYQNVAGFDNIGAAMLTAFQVSTVAGWSHVFYRTWDGTIVISIVYFGGIIMMVSYVVMNLFLAGLKLKFAAASSDAMLEDRERRAQPADVQQDVSTAVAAFRYMSGVAKSTGGWVTSFFRSDSEDTNIRKPSIWKQIQGYIRPVVEHSAFSQLFMALILVNTFAMAVEYDGMSSTMQDNLATLNTILTWAFAGEVVLKIIGLGMLDFFSEGFNVFDFFVVAISMVEVGVMMRTGGEGGSLSALRSFKTLRILKSFRVLRMLRMFRYLDGLRALGEVLLDSLESFGAVSFLCLLFLLVFSILGLHLFGEIELDITFPNFNSFFNAFITVFQVVTLENWEEIMFSTMRSSDNRSSFLFFVAWVLIGKFTLLSLFLAVIMEAFEVAHERIVAEHALAMQDDLLGSGAEGGVVQAHVAHTMPPAQSSDTQRLISSGVAASGRQGAPVVDTVFSFEAPVDTLPLRREVPAERGTQDQPGPPVVPPLSAHQMLAAKREQQRSMIAYSMQLQGHRVPAEQYEELLAADIAYTESISPRMHGASDSNLPPPPSVHFPVALSNRSGIFASPAADSAANSAVISPRIAPMSPHTAPVGTLVEPAVLSTAPVLLSTPTATRSGAAPTTTRSGAVGEALDRVHRPSEACCHSLPSVLNSCGSSQGSFASIVSSPDKHPACEHEISTHGDSTRGWDGDEPQLLGLSVSQNSSSDGASANESHYRVHTTNSCGRDASAISQCAAISEQDDTVHEAYQEPGVVSPTNVTGAPRRARAVAEAREHGASRSSRASLAAPRQSAQSHAAPSLETSEELAAPAHGALDINMQAPRTSEGPSRHSRANAAAVARTHGSHASSASAARNVLQACSSVLSAEPSYETLGNSSRHGPPHAGGFMHAVEGARYTNVLFRGANSIDGSEELSSPSSVAAAAAAALESENSALTMEISRTVAGSLCIPYEPHDPTDTDPSSSGRGTVSTVCKPRSDTTRNSFKSLRWGDGALAADNSWATVAREESMHNLLENDSGVAVPAPVPVHSGITRQQRVASGRSNVFKRDWTKSQSRIATVKAGQEAAAVARYNRRLKHMHGAFLASRNSNMETHMAALKAAGGASLLLTRGHVNVFARSDRRSLEKLRGTFEEKRSNVQVANTTGTDHSVAVAMATNPLIGILDASEVDDADACAGEGGALQLPDGTCLLSPFCLLEAATVAANRPEMDSDEVPIPEEVFGMGTSHPLRRAVIAVTLHWVFDIFMTLAIVVSCGSMVFERPTLPDDSAMMAYLKTSNLVLTVIFAIEGVLKIVTYSPRAYWQSHSNKIDAFIVFISVLLMSVEDSGLEIFKSLRTLRALKALRVATRSEGMKNLVSLVISSMSSILNVSLLLMLVEAIFGILGVQLFSGMFYRCNDTTVAGVEECVGTFTDSAGGEVARVWNKPFYSFDSFVDALLSLFVVATLDGYSPIMEDAISVPIAKGMQPQPHTAQVNALFFVAFIVVTVFVMLNLFVGLIFFHFQKLSAERAGLAELNIVQKEWMAVVPYLLSLEYQKVPVPPSGGSFRRWCYKLATNDYFDYFILFLVCINVIEMCVWWYGIDDGTLAMKENVNLVLSALFGMECIVKVSGLGWKEYWSSGWNKLDFSLVMLSVVDIAFAYLESSVLRLIKVLKAQKLLRLLRVTRMAKALKTMRSMLHLLLAIKESLGAILQVLALITVIFFIFAYMGVLLFAKVKRGSYLNAHANFEHFGNALLILTRVTTNDDWAGLVGDLAVKPPHCDLAAGSFGQNYFVTAGFFGTFVMLNSILMLNLFATIIIQNFEVLQSQERWAFNPQQISQMIRSWGNICRTDGTISRAQLVKLVRTLAPPIGTGPQVSPSEAESHIQKAGVVPVLGSRYTFEHTVFALVAAVAEVPVPENSAAARANKSIGQHFVKVYSKLGIVWGSSPGEAFADHGKRSALWRLATCCCAWMPCMRSPMARKTEAETGIEVEQSRWSIFPSFAGGGGV